jgi:hypothetical protein
LGKSTRSATSAFPRCLMGSLDRICWL